MNKIYRKLVPFVLLLSMGLTAAPEDFIDDTESQLLRYLWRVNNDLEYCDAEYVLFSGPSSFTIDQCSLHTMISLLKDSTYSSEYAEELTELLEAFSSFKKSSVLKLRHGL